MCWCIVIFDFFFGFWYGVRVFEILRFFMKTPGWVMHGFRRYTLNVLMYSYLWFFLAFSFFLRKKSKDVWTKRRCISQSPFFQKRAFSFIYLAKTEGLWSFHFPGPKPLRFTERYERKSPFLEKRALRYASVFSRFYWGEIVNPRKL